MPQKLLLGRFVVSGFEPVAFLGHLLVQRHEDKLSATLLAVGPAPFARQEKVEQRQQERPKLSLLPVGQQQTLLRDELCERLLSQILGFVRTVAFAPDVDVDWIPVSAAQSLQRALGGRRITLPSLQDHAPMRGCEDPWTHCL